MVHRHHPGHHRYHIQSIFDTGEMSCMPRAQRTLKDKDTISNHCLFSLLPSGKRYRSNCCHTVPSDYRAASLVRPVFHPSTPACRPPPQLKSDSVGNIAGCKTPQFIVNTPFYKKDLAQRTQTFFLNSCVFKNDNIFKVLPRKLSSPWQL